jgi:hypothetical protein
VVECCADYIKDGKRIGFPIPLHEGRLRGRERMGQKTFADRDYSLVSEAHFSVLQQHAIASRTSTNTCQSCKEITRAT